MKRAGFGWIVFVVVCLVGAATSIPMGTGAQDDIDIDGLQTQIAPYVATNAALSAESAVPTEASTDGDTDEASGGSANGGEESNETPVETGGTIATEVWAIAIDDAEPRESIELYEVFTARGIYLVLTVQIANLTKIPLEFPYDELEVVDGEGRSFRYQDTITANLINERYAPLFGYSLLQPGLLYKSAVVFELSKESESLVLELNDTSPARNREAEQAADEAREVALPLGSAVQSGNWEITITGTEFQPILSSIWGDLAAREIYLVAYATAINTGSEPDYFPYEGVLVVDSEGRWFGFNQSPTDGLSLELTDQQYWEKLQAGIPYQIAIVFDVPAAAKDYLFVPNFN